MPPGGPVLLLAGDQTQAYRLELALRTFARVLEGGARGPLLVTGRLVSPVEPLLDELGVQDRVELVGEYAQRDAPDLMRRAHLLLHTKVKDPCPSAVIEAMACGLPVVYPASGGTVELVGDEAGIGVPHPESWERDEPPSPEALADAVLRVLADRAAYAAAARKRAVERFALEPWLDRHARAIRPADATDASTQISPQPSAARPSPARRRRALREGARGCTRPCARDRRSAAVRLLGEGAPSSRDRASARG